MSQCINPSVCEEAVCALSYGDYVFTTHTFTSRLPLKFSLSAGFFSGFFPCLFFLLIDVSAPGSQLLIWRVGTNFESCEWLLLRYDHLIRSVRSKVFPKCMFFTKFMSLFHATAGRICFKRSGRGERAVTFSERMIPTCKLCRAASVTNGTIWIVSSHKHAEAKIRSDSVSFSPHTAACQSCSLRLYHSAFPFRPLLFPSLSPPASFFLSSLQHLEGFIHPNPSVLLTRINSLHSFHSHLDSPSLSLSFFGFNLFPVFISFVSPPPVPRRLPLLSPLFFSYCFGFFHCELTPYLCQRKSSVMSTHLQVWQGCWQFEFLPLKLKPSAEHSGKTLRYRSDLSWTALSGCPCLVSLFTPPVSHTNTDRCWPHVLAEDYLRCLRGPKHSFTVSQQLWAEAHGHM